MLREQGKVCMVPTAIWIDRRMIVGQEEEQNNWEKGSRGFMISGPHVHSPIPI